MCHYLGRLWSLEKENFIGGQCQYRSSIVNWASRHDGGSDIKPSRASVAGHN